MASAPRRDTAVDRNATRSELTAAIERAASATPIGTYLTDGATLFHIEQARWDNRRGGLLVELEDCRTLELVLYPAQALTGRDLRTVTPASV